MPTTLSLISMGPIIFPRHVQNGHVGRRCPIKVRGTLESHQEKEKLLAARVRTEQPSAAQAHAPGPLYHHIHPTLDRCAYIYPIPSSARPRGDSGSSDDDGDASPVENRYFASRQPLHLLKRSSHTCILPAPGGAAAPARPPIVCATMEGTSEG